MMLREVIRGLLREQIEFAVWKNSITLKVDGNPVGKIMIEKISEEDMLGYAGDHSDSCKEDLEYFKQKIGKQLNIFEATSSSVFDSISKTTGAGVGKKNLNKGYGIELYVKAAQLAAEHGGVLVMHGCGKHTSAEAKRVWNSRRFKQRVHIGPNGTAAWAG